MLKKYNNRKLESILYDELYDESDFLFYAIDYVNEVEELEALLDSSNETLILKVLTLLKEKESMSEEHRNFALQRVLTPDVKSIISVL